MTKKPHKEEVELNLTRLHQQWLSYYESLGIKTITCIDARRGCSGQASVEVDSDTYTLMVRGDPRDPMFLFVIFHEYAHIALGHVGRIKTIPVWQTKYQANIAALHAIALFAPETVEICTADAKEHLLRIIQPYVNDEIDNHLNLAVIDWCGAKIKKRHRNRLKQIEKDYFGYEKEN